MNTTLRERVRRMSGRIAEQRAHCATEERGRWWVVEGQEMIWYGPKGQTPVFFTHVTTA